MDLTEEKIKLSRLFQNFPDEENSRFPLYFYSLVIYYPINDLKVDSIRK